MASVKKNIYFDKNIMTRVGVENCQLLALFHNHEVAHKLHRESVQIS